jgi:hypothetical protein
MSLAAKKSDLKNHLSRSVKKHYLNTIGTTELQNDTAMAGEGVTADGDNSIASRDHDERSSSAGVYAPNSIGAQD